jgi:hypothetical protein
VIKSVILCLHSDCAHLYHRSEIYSVNLVEVDHVTMWIQTVKGKDFNVTVLFVITQRTECFSYNFKTNDTFIDKCCASSRTSNTS